MFNEIVSPSVPNLPVRIAYWERGTASTSVQPHFHNEVELLAVTKGKLSYTIENETYEILPGEVAFINSRVPHSTTTCDDTINFLIQINTFEFLDNRINKHLSNFINNSEVQTVLFKKENYLTKDIFKYINAIIDEEKLKRPAYATHIKGNTYLILAFLFRNDILIDVDNLFHSNNISKILPALEFVDEHYNTQITLEDVSNTLNLVPHYFCRLFKNVTNSTFTEYLNFVRISIAEKLIVITTKSITEIAFETGFSSVTYFSKVFKKLNNCSPTAYRKIKYSS